MKNKRIKVMAILIALVLVINGLPQTIYASNEDITYTINEILSEDGLSSTITLTLQTSSKVKEIVKVDTPDGRSIEKQNTITQVITENKDYSFTVYYTYLQEDTEIQPIEKQEVITYQETKIQQVVPIAGSIQPIVPNIQSLLARTTTATSSVEATGDVAINEENFPDANFRNYLLTDTTSEQIKGYGQDGVFTVAELNDIKKIYVVSKSISNLKGLDYFTALTELHCNKNQLTSLDVSNNTKLKYLACATNQLTSLDVSNNTALTNLYCYRNELTSLDVSKNTVLRVLSCSYNQLTSLDVSTNTALKELGAYSNAITSIIGNPPLTACDLTDQTVSITTTQKSNTPIWSGNTTTFNNNVTFDNTDLSYDGTLKQMSITKPTDSISSTFICANAIGSNTLSGTVTVTSDEYFVPVTNITGPTRVFVDDLTPLEGTITPTNTTYDTIVWSIKNDGGTGATLNGNILKVTNVGTVELTATVADGATTGAYTKDISVIVDYANPSALVGSYNGSTLPGAKANWYTGDVTITPPSGYQISNTLGSGYTSQVTITTSNPTVYLKEISSGKLYSGKVLSEVNIDRVDPSITGIDDNGTSNGDIIVTVSDDNLESVLLYTYDTLTKATRSVGVPQTIDGTTSMVTLKALDKDQYYKIEAMDKSGRTTIYNYKIEVAKDLDITIPPGGSTEIPGAGGITNDDGTMKDVQGNKEEKKVVTNDVTSVAEYMLLGCIAVIGILVNRKKHMY